MTTSVIQMLWVGRLQLLIHITTQCGTELQTYCVVETGISMRAGQVWLMEEVTK